jgi:glutathione synthase/RimK-type ligase-like ATP-grasp enzyme
MSTVLFISSLSERYYYDAFVREAEKQGLNVYILDPEDFTENRLSIHLNAANGVDGYLEAWKLGDNENKVERISWNTMSVAWHLRVQRKRPLHKITDYLERFRENESLHALQSALSVLPCTWVNTWEAIDTLSTNKLLQQKLARQSGLRVPITVVSNDPKKILAFAERCGGRLLVKTFGNTRLDEKDELVIYSELFGAQELSESAEAIAACPIYAQEYIPKLYEYRVVVAGDSILTCRIASQSSEKTKIDWRHYDFQNVEHVACKLPDSIEVAILKFMRLARLRFGSIDLIETPCGEFVFLEINPSGQWDWISKLAQLPIAERVARMLTVLCE